MPGFSVDRRRPAGGLAQPAYLAQDPALRTPLHTQRPDAVNKRFATPSNTQGVGHNVTASYDFDQDVHGQGCPGYRETDVQSTSQLDVWEGSVLLPLRPAFPFIAPSLGVPVPQTFPHCWAQYRRATKTKWSNEATAQRHG